MGGVVHNEKYWNINPKDKSDLGLPKTFHQIVLHLRSIYE
jgi:hypothetical protein